MLPWHLRLYVSCDKIRHFPISPLSMILCENHERWGNVHDNQQTTDFLVLVKDASVWEGWENLHSNSGNKNMHHNELITFFQTLWQKKLLRKWIAVRCFINQNCERWWKYQTGFLAVSFFTRDFSVLCDTHYTSVQDCWLELCSFSRFL